MLRICITDTGSCSSSNRSNAAYTLSQPGSTLSLSALLVAKKYRDRGGKEAAIKAMRELERNGLGKLIEKPARHGTSAVRNLTNIYCMYIRMYTYININLQVYFFEKASIPHDNNEL